MTKDDCFLEAHFYSGGLRHATFPKDRRAEWAPPSDSVGFRDDVEMATEDRVVEVRRFDTPSGRLSWIAVYFRSIDAKHGDRRNHAGIGAWFLNSIPYEISELLKGLELLAKSISEDQDVARVRNDALRFQSEFLPKYALDLHDVEPASGFEFGPVGIIDTHIFETQCDGPLAECGRLSEHLIRVSFTDSKRIPGRILYHVRRGSGAKEDLTPTGDIGAQLLRWFPTMREKDRKRAELAEQKCANADARAVHYEEQITTLKSELEELDALRNDPLRLVLDEVRQLSRKVDAIADRPAPIPVAAYSGSRNINRGPSRGPINTSTAQPNVEDSDGSISNLIFPVALIMIFLFIVVMLYLIVDRYLPAMF